MVSGVEIGYNTGASAMQMAETIFGDGVTVVSASYTGDNRSSAIYTNGDLTGGVAPSDTGVILSTGQASSFTTSNRWQSNTSASTTTNTSGVNNDTDFNTISGGSTYDAAWLDVSFIPTGDTLTLSFVFASEEFPEYTTSSFNDAVGVWVNGVHVPLSIGDGTTSVNNVGGPTGSNLYVDNTQDQYNTEMDGFTVTMTLNIPVDPNILNTIKIGIADVGDSSYDSNILIAADSGQTTLIAVTDDVSMYANGTKTFDLLGNDTNSTSGTLQITEINGVPVSAGSTVTLSTGQTITVNADGTITVVADSDGEAVNFTYQVDALSGSTVVGTSTGIVNLDVIPCFVSGTLISTTRGTVPVEDLSVGDMVLTMDEGPQPLRWIGNREVEATGKMAPVLIEANAIGEHDALLVSPQHRVLMRDPLAALLFGEEEVLVKARDLVNGSTIRHVEGGTVTYHHILFDRHQVVYSEGLPTESFHPGPQATKQFDPEVLEEICTLFPELTPETGMNHGPAARLSLKSYEARLLAEAAA
ncbi:Hint domain-containing protein [Marivivens sp. JLT3646]|uniref:Hint domain-containing protein n=1 Tax=Marivivens sp. JLT3646 TaxID=1920883 RepID=UPI000800DBC9|nr:Hint domain-containing protein [Marivivens sp. JLT3646]APO87869.1 2,3,4,5-tetrahydropyridine-2,6-carboxylate N-succinyltransferase [Marivivens sp. JLT3646]OBR38603.1 2,3,4,5-tetrahydropyridine-2,6-carboxylate N-succinyltransferase [Donghicola sp. JL3646]